MKSACASSLERAGLPCLPGATSPVARFNRAHAPAVALPIPNRAAAASVEAPASIAATTRSRKSRSYALAIASSLRRQGRQIKNQRSFPLGIPDSAFVESALDPGTRAPAQWFMHDN